MNYPSSFSWRLLIAVFGWWFFWCVLCVCIVHRFGFAWNLSIVDVLVNNGLLAFATFASAQALKYYQPGSKNYVFHLGWVLALSLLVIAGTHKLLMLVNTTDYNYLYFLEQSLPVRFGYAILMISFSSLASWVGHLVAEQKKNDNRKKDAEQLLREAELSNLRQQLQPHFLFNSLNSISALAGSKPNEARKMVQQLSDFLRGTLKKDEQQLVKLREELDHLKLYLDIERVRFGHRLQAEVVCSEDCETKLLPSLLLQPIVENAIKFGLYDTIDNITIRIVANCKEQQLTVSVSNPFDPATAKAQQGTGFGLNAVQRRLYLLYARQDLLQTEQHNNVFTTTLMIPQ
jgi:two-component system, LytTR family, sensor kinase